MTKGKLAFFHSFIASVANYLIEPVFCARPGARSQVSSDGDDIRRDPCTDCVSPRRFDEDVSFIKPAGRVSDYTC